MLGLYPLASEDKPVGPRRHTRGEYAAHWSHDHGDEHPRSPCPEEAGSHPTTPRDAARRRDLARNLPARPGHRRRPVRRPSLGSSRTRSPRTCCSPGVTSVLNRSHRRRNDRRMRTPGPDTVELLLPTRRGGWFPQDGIPCISNLSPEVFLAGTRPTRITQDPPVSQGDLSASTGNMQSPAWAAMRRTSIGSDHRRASGRPGCVSIFTDGGDADLAKHARERGPEKSRPFAATS